MLKIGIAGTDGGAKSGHSASICRKISSGIYDAEISAVMGCDKRETEEVCALCGENTRVAKSIDELTEQSDAVMVLFRNGNMHLAYAEAALRAGKTVFVDKPLACTLDDAESIIRAAEQSGAPLCSGSQMKYSVSLNDIKKAVGEKCRDNISSVYISFPLVDLPQYGGIHFYSHHIIEEYYSVFDADIREVTAKRTSKNISVIADCGSFPLILNCGVWYGSTHFGVYFKDGSNIFKEVELDGEERQIEEFISAAKSKKPSVDYERQLLPVRISRAIAESLDSGLTVRV